jgi:hypothetical protein
LIKNVLLLTLITAASFNPVFAEHHGEASAKTSSLKEFEELCARLEGRWNVDIIWINEWPGTDAVRGETVKGHAKCTRILDGAALEMKSMQGKEETTHLWYYDAATSQIRMLRLTSGGTSFNGLIFKISDTEYGEQFSGAQKDGRAVTGTLKRVFSKDGRSFMLRSKNIKLDGKPLGELKDTYTKVSP